MRRSRTLLGAMVLLASCASQSSDPLEEAVRAITKAREGAFGEASGYPVEPWIDLFREDATIVMARGEATADTDYVMSRLQFGGVVRMEHCRHQYMGAKFDVRSRRKVGDGVEITIEPDLDGVLAVERLTMRKLDGKWRVAKSRHWRERWFGMHGERFEIDEAHWAKVDAKLDALIAKGKSEGAMFDAEREQAFGRFAQLLPDNPSGRSEGERRMFGQTMVRGGQALTGGRWIANDPAMSEAEVRKYLIDWCATAARVEEGE